MREDFRAWADFEYFEQRVSGDYDVAIQPQIIEQPLTTEHRQLERTSHHTKHEADVHKLE
jgi:hypothetical protein